MLGHPTGRLLLARDGYAVDLDAVIEAAAEAGTMIEINANPHRLDLDATHCRRAHALGVTIVDQPRRPLDRRPGGPGLRDRRRPPRGARPGRRLQHAPPAERSPALETRRTALVGLRFTTAVGAVAPLRGGPAIL